MICSFKRDFLLRTVGSVTNYSFSFKFIVVQIMKIGK